MDKKVLYDTKDAPFISVELNPQGWLYACWQGEIDDEKVKAGAKAILEATQESGCIYLVNDNTLLEGSWLSAIDWLIDEEIPRIEKAGNKYMAHVLSPEFITKFSAIELDARLGKEGFRLFYDLEMAEDWIRSIM